MDYIRLNNGLCIPGIGYGTHPNKESLLKAVPRAYNTGYRLYDTSDNYYNEQFLGEGLKGLTDEVYLITKYSVSRNIKYFFQDFEDSRKKLGKDIDVYLLHWPYKHIYTDLWRKMEELYLSGKVKAIGVCNFECEHLEKLLAVCTVKPVMNQIEVHPYFQQKEICDYCNKNDIQVISYSPFARMNSGLITDTSLQRIADKSGRSVQQIIIRWNIQKGYIPIPSTINDLHMAENFDVFDFQLDKRDMDIMNSLEKGMRIRFDPKTRFGRRESLNYLRMHLSDRLKNRRMKG